MNLRYPYAALAISIVALALASCGSTGTTTTTAEKPSIAFGTPALTAARAIPASYRCNNRRVWVPLRWGALPANTRELALYVVRFASPKVTPGGQVKAEINAEALVLGLDPKLRKLKPGRYPHGALIAIHSRHGEPVSICPPRGQAQNLLFRIYALNRKLHLTRTSKVNPLREVIRSTIEQGTFIARYRPA